MPDLSRALNPRSIAFIGGKDAAEALRVCKRFGFDGQVLPVSPTRTEMHGVATVASVDDLPAAPDLAFVAVNRHLTVEVVRQLAEAGAGAAICYAAGFTEVADGAELTDQLIEAAGDMPIIGPNCYGLINANTGACAWASEHGLARCEGPGVAIIGQSSNIVINMTMQARGLPIVRAATVGNQVQTGLSTLALAMLDDPNVTALGLHIEGIDSQRGFEALAARARTLGKPVVVLKVGASEGAQRAAKSHTAAVAGSDAGASAFFKRLGLARVETLPQFLETLKLLHVHGALPNCRLSAMCCSGGETSLWSDAAEQAKAWFPKLSPRRFVAIKESLGPLVAVANPLDYHTFIWADLPKVTATYSAMIDAQAFDLNILTLDWVRSDRCDDRDWWPQIEALKAAQSATGARVAVATTLPENLPESLAVQLIASGIVPLAGIEDALAAVDAAAFIGEAWCKAAPQALTPAADLNDGRSLTELAAKDLLAEAGVPIPRQDGPGPFAVKAMGIDHKTEAGAVLLNMAENQLTAALVDLGQRTGADEFLIEEMVRDCPIELLVGVKQDPPFGLSLTLGAGGRLVELWNDSTTLLLPATRIEIDAALARLKIGRLLAGYRGSTPVNRAALLDAIEAIAAFAINNASRLAEMDINPLMCGPERAVAADALIIMQEFTTS